MKHAKYSGSPEIQGSNLFERLHKVQELVWKQKFLAIPILSLSQDDLFEMEEKDFQKHHVEIGELFLQQWNLRQNRIHMMVAAQKNMGIELDKRHNLNDLMRMSGKEFDRVSEKISSAYSAYILRSSGSGSDFVQAMMDEKSTCGLDKKFDIDGCRSNADYADDENDYEYEDEFEDESEDEDDDVDLIMFKGRG